MSENTPLLPRPAHASQPDSHPIFLRACHSPWRLINQKILLGLRFVLTGYLTAVFGVSLKWKLENDDSHTPWRIPFQFSTVSFVLLWTYHMIAFVWTMMHLAAPQPTEEDPDECHGHRFRHRILVFLSPPRGNSSELHKYTFSLFYTVAHVFAFTNTIIYWAVLVPAGHGGFMLPGVPHHNHHSHDDITVLYDPNKGLFEEDDIKPFSIISLWTMTSLIACIEIFLLNSIRRQTPVAAHTAGIMFSTAAYVAWAILGKLITGHAGLFFLDPDLMGNQYEAVIAASVAFVTFTPGIFSYVYGLIAMRESMTAAHQHSDAHH